MSLSLLPVAAVAILHAQLSPTTVQPHLLRTPAVYGESIVFSYAGDLWKAKVNSAEPATRLTTAPGLEIRPKISPDGKWIAFNGQYDGNSEIYLMPMDGGEPKRLTWSPDGKNVVGWTADGKVAFASLMGSFTNRQLRLWTVDPKGGLPTPTKVDELTEASFFPDGHTMAYTRTNTYANNWRKYRGGTQGRISLYNFATNSYSELPSGREQSWFPMAVGRSVYYVSDKSLATLNLYRFDLDSHKDTRLTAYTDSDVRYPNTDGKSIVWERDGELYLYDIATNTVTPQYPKIPSENLGTRPVFRRLGAAITSVSMSPSGARIAVDARGQIFSVPVKNGDTRNLTHNPGAKAQFARWSPDGTTIAYLSDATGNVEVFTQPQLGGDPVQLTTGQLPGIEQLDWSPDGKYLQLQTSANELYILETATKKLTLVLKSGYGIRDEDWSADGKWIAVVNTLSNGLGALFLYEVGTGRITQATSGLYDDDNVAFDQNGKYIYLVSTRTFSPGFGHYELSLKTENDDRLYVIPLSESEGNPLTAPDEEEPAAAPQPHSPSGPGPAGAGPGGPASTVRVDFEGLENRMLPIPIPAGSFNFLIGANNGVIYSTNPSQGLPLQSIQRFDLMSRQATPILQAPKGALSINNARTKGALYANGVLGTFDIRPGPPVAPARVDTSGVEATIDPSQEWREIFWDAWRFERNHYYDPNMKGLNWLAIGKRYATYLPYVGDRNDLNYVIGQMIGELGTSHSYVMGGDMGLVSPTPPIGQLGADYEVSGNHIKFAKIYRGQNFAEGRRGPLGAPGVDVNPGDYLLAIDGSPVTAEVNPNSMLLDKVGKFVTLTVNSSPSPAGARKVRVQPIGSETELRNTEWILERRALVDKLSDGRVGYMYIPDTGLGGVSAFIEGYYSQSNKDAILVDERWNSGGFIPGVMVDALERRARAAVESRDSTVHPDQSAINGPKAMLINQYAGSGGDMFPWMFRHDKLGPLIGERTWGGLVGINGYYSLVDGGQVTAPTAAFFDPDTGEIIAENQGIDPDITVDRRPDEVAKGQDTQLEAGVKYLMEQLAKYPPKPLKQAIPVVGANGRIKG